MHVLSKTRLIHEPYFRYIGRSDPSQSSCGYTSQSFENACSNHLYISLLLYCTTHVSHVTIISGWQLSSYQSLRLPIFPSLRNVQNFYRLYLRHF